MLRHQCLLFAQNLKKQKQQNISLRCSIENNTPFKAYLNYNTFKNCNNIYKKKTFQGQVKHTKFKPFVAKRDNEKQTSTGPKVNTVIYLLLNVIAQLKSKKNAKQIRFFLIATSCTHTLIKHKTPLCLKLLLFRIFGI